MAWHLVVLNGLAHAAVGGSLFLVAGCLALRCCRQPVLRVRIIELTLLGAALLPLAAQLPWLPHWSMGLVRIEPVATVPAFPSAPPGELAPGPTSLPHFRSPAANTFSATKGAPDRPAVLLPPENGEDVRPPVTVEPPAPVSLTLPGLIVAAYGTVTACLLAWSLAGMVSLARLARSAYPAPPRVADLFREIAGRAGQGVRLLVSDRIELALTYRGWRPVILLPGSLCRGGDTEALRFGLAHEWSHVESGDVPRWYLASLAQLLFFYQPLFWWLRRQLRLCQDYLADARAAEQARRAEDYAQYLVGLARRRLGVPAAAALGIGDRRSNLYRRIIMLLESREPLARRCLTSWTFGTGLASFTLLALLSAVRLDAGAPPAADEKKPAKETPKTPPRDEPTKGETLNYTGRVTDKDTGKPIQGVTVTVRRSLYGDPKVKPENMVLQETRHQTDADGKYSFTIPPEQTSQRYLYVELDVEHPDYAPQKHFGYALGMIRKNEKLGGRPFFENVEMRAGKPITGLIKTPSGAPAAGVKVLAYSVTDKRGESFEYGSFADTVTDATGQFRLVLTTPGKAAFWILPEKYAPSSHAVLNNKRGDLGTFTLNKGLVLRGKVLDVKGKSLAGVNVNADSREPNEALQGLPVADAINRSAVTNDRGEFEMAPLPPGKYQVQPGDYATDGSGGRKRFEVPDVFVAQTVQLKEDAKSQDIEVRAVPHVTIEARYLDSKGKPTRGHECSIFGQMDKNFWHTRGKPDADGKFLIPVPHGLEQVRMDLMTNEHGVLRHRKSKDAPLSNTRQVDLGTVNDDVKGIEIIRYVAPILVVNAVDKDGKQIKGFKAKAVYQPGRGNKEPGSSFVNGVQGDVYFENQEDGRWRSSQMFPDEEVTVTASADGYQEKSEHVKLEEGVTKELTLVLEKAPAKTPEKKEEKK